jgi:hypothetical protein
MAVEQRIYDLSLDAARDLSDNQFHVMEGSGEFGCDVSSAADEDSLGILQNKPDAAGQAAEIRRVGISKAECGGVIPVWTKVTPDDDGHIVVALTHERYIGFAMQAGIATRIISVLMEFGYVEEAS